MRTLLAAATLAVGIVLGVSMGVAWAESQAAPAAYVVVGGRMIDASGLEAYAEVATPGAQAAGIELLARNEGEGLHLVEGTMPTEGFIAVERFRSLDDFLGFEYTYGRRGCHDSRRRQGTAPATQTGAVSSRHCAHHQT